MNKVVIINKIFNQSSIKDVETLINNIKSINTYTNDYNYEVELRIIDDFKGLSCDKHTYKNFSLEGFYKINYNDNITVSYKSLSRKTYIRTDLNNKHVEKKTNIATIPSISNKNQKKTLMPIVIKLNIESSIDMDNVNKDNLIFNNSKNILNYQRKQRISYKTNIPLLKNWRIDKTVRLFSTDINDKKISFTLTEDNVINPIYYDKLDIEFEYIGEYVNFEDSLFKLFEFIYVDEFKTFNIMYNNINNILLKSYNIDFTSIYSDVGIITNNFIKNENIEEYVYEEKFDGERVSIVILKQFIKNEEYLYIYEYTKKYFKLLQFKINTYDSPNTSKYNDNNILTIIDAEKIENYYGYNKHLYIVFDCILLENTYINELPYIKRLKYCKKFISIFSEYIQCYCPKCYSIKIDKDDYINNYRNKWKQLINVVNTRSETIDENLKGIKIDGLILHKNTSNFINGELYKLKNPILNTIDFMLKWIEEKQVFYLYLVGFPCEVTKRLPIINNYSKKHFGYSLVNKVDSSYILFDNPYIPNLYEFEPSLLWYETDNENNKFLNKEMIDNINHLMQKIINNPTNYNGVIVELSLYRKNNCYQWLPMRIRKDKVFSNGYRIGVSNIESIYNMLTPKYFASNDDTSTDQPTLMNKSNDISTYESITSSSHNDINTSHINTSKASINKTNDNIQTFYKSLFEQYIINDKLPYNNQNTNKYNILWNLCYDDVFPSDLIKLYNIENIYLVAEDKLTLINNYNNINEENKKLFKPNQSIFLDVSCVAYDSTKYGFTNDIYNNLLQSSFIPKSINIYIDNNFNKFFKNKTKYIEYLDNVMSLNCIYIILSDDEITNIKELDMLFDTKVKNELINMKMSNTTINKYISIFVRTKYL